MRTSRREFLQGAAGVLLGPPAAARPNLLFLFSDEHRAQSWPSEVTAPNMARLATQGVSFSRCVSNYPVCSPYRAMLLSGRWPFSTGVVDNGLPLRAEETSLGKVFRDAGYKTGYIGKWHLGQEGVFQSSRHGFDYWRPWYATNAHFDKSFYFDDEGKKYVPRGYNATLMTDQALGFLERHRADPWMLMVSWNPPHPNYRDAPTEQMKLYDPAGLPLRPNVTMKDARLERLRLDWQGYNAHITAVDAELGRLLRKLDELRLAENTIVIYTSDHGDMMGSQGRMGKRLPHEESALVPFLARWPGHIPAGITRPEFLGTIDLYPSLCALAGVGAPKHCEGRDLSSSFLGGESRAPDSAFLMHIDKHGASGGIQNPAPIFRGVRTTRYTYAAGETGP
ncbi:MAG: sulfatase [Acidobacteria bacterium]|nr:sulfatase [Acidobacteriota bacterium]